MPHKIGWALLFFLLIFQKSSLCLCKFCLFREKHQRISGLASSYFFEGLQNYMASEKRERNEQNIILGNFNFALVKMDRGGGNKTHTLYRCGSNYTQSKLTLDNGIEDLWRMENSVSSEFICYNRIFGTRSTIDGSILM